MQRRPWRPPFVLIVSISIFSTPYVLFELLVFSYSDLRFMQNNSKSLPAACSCPSCLLLVAPLSYIDIQELLVTSSTLEHSQRTSQMLSGMTRGFHSGCSPKRLEVGRLQRSLTALLHHLPPLSQQKNGGLVQPGFHPSLQCAIKVLLDLYPFLFSVLKHQLDYQLPLLYLTRVLQQSSAWV